MSNSFTGALARKRSELGQKEKGFTLIELLVVVIIIGVLAAIAIPIFLGQQDQAKDAGVKSDLATAKVAWVSYLVEVPGGTATIPLLEAKGLVQTNPASITIGSPAPSFCIDGASPTTKKFHITHNAGVKNGTCAVPTP